MSGARQPRMLRTNSATTMLRVDLQPLLLDDPLVQILELSGSTVSNSVPQYRHRSAIALIVSPQAGHFLVSPQADSGVSAGAAFSAFGALLAAIRRATADVGPALAVMHLLAERADHHRLARRRRPSGRSGRSRRACGPARAEVTIGRPLAHAGRRQLGLAARAADREAGGRLGQPDPGAALTRDDGWHGLAILPSFRSPSQHTRNPPDREQSAAPRRGEQAILPAFPVRSGDQGLSYIHLPCHASGLHGSGRAPAATPA